MHRPSPLCTSPYLMHIHFPVHIRHSLHWDNPVMFLWIAGVCLGSAVLVMYALHRYCSDDVHAHRTGRESVTGVKSVWKNASACPV